MVFDEDERGPQTLQNGTAVVPALRRQIPTSVGLSVVRVRVAPDSK